MTVYENFYFYGYLHGMSGEQIRARADELISFLQIPSGDRMVQSMRYKKWFTYAVLLECNYYKAL